MSQSPQLHSHEAPAQKRSFVTETRIALWVAGWSGLFGMGIWLSDAAHFLCELELGSNVDNSTAGSCTDPPLSDVHPAVFAIWLLPLGATVWLLASKKRLDSPSAADSCRSFWGR